MSAADYVVPSATVSHYFPPPTGNGSWKDGAPQSVKDRWVFVLRADPRRDAILSVKDGRSVAA